MLEINQNELMRLSQETREKLLHTLFCIENDLQFSNQNISNAIDFIFDYNDLSLQKQFENRIYSLVGINIRNMVYNLKEDTQDKIDIYKEFEILLKNLFKQNSVLLKTQGNKHKFDLVYEDTIYNVEMLVNENYEICKIEFDKGE